jgi:hypothetical protein
MSKVRIEKERKVITYVAYWRTSTELLGKAQSEARGSYYLFMSSLVFSAFALEAFLNHIGEHLFQAWDDLESLNARAKINVICERLDLTPNWGALPWQIVPEIVGFRNKVAHGKNALLKFEKTVSVDNYEDILHQFLMADWQDYATESNAIRVQTHLENLFEVIHTKAAIENDVLFRDGFQSQSATALRE